MDGLLRELLADPEAIGGRDGFPSGSGVREGLGDPISSGSVEVKPGCVMPDDDGMPEEEGRLIRAALPACVERTGRLAPSPGLQAFHLRPAACRDDAARTDAGGDQRDLRRVGAGGV